MRFTAHFLDGDVRRTSREQRRHLKSDIECFATSAERQELLDALVRYPDSQTTEVRATLDRELAREQFDNRFIYTHLSRASLSR